MASSSVERSRPAELAAFSALAEKAATACLLCRHARAADLTALAATQAESLYGDDSFVAVRLRTSESYSLANLTFEARGAEKEALHRRSWKVLLSVIPLLLRRIAANTLLPGTVLEEELDFFARQQAALAKAKNLPNFCPVASSFLVAGIGYTTLLEAMFRSLDLLSLPYWPAVERRSVESFVLQGLDVIARTAGMSARAFISEGELATAFEVHMHPRDYEPTFYADVLRKWRSDEVSSVLRARGVLQTGIAGSERTKAEFEARQRADIAKHGLRDCALLSCAKTERTVKEFAGCSGCRSVVYCCLEHQALDWRAHKKACREIEAARLSANEEAGTVNGAGPAAD